MSYQLGVDLGTTFTCAAVYDGGEARILELGARSASIPSVIFLEESGSFLVGDAAERRATLEPRRAAREFKRRFGDTTPIFVGGSPYSADALTAELLKSVYASVVEREGGPPSAIAITHPANWGPYKLELLEQVVRRADLDSAILLTEPEAAVLKYAQLERVPDGAVVAVFDLGGGTFDASVIRKTPDGVETLGKPEGLERLGGIDLDETVFNFVVQHLDGALDDIDMDDETVISALARLRTECVDAKVALSSDESASVQVMLPGAHTSVRMTRGEFESLVRPSLSSAIEALQRALRSADVSNDEVTALLLAGGSSRIPLVAEMVGTSIGRPIAVDAHPKHLVAMGAAIAAAEAMDAASSRAATVDTQDPTPEPGPGLATPPPAPPTPPTAPPTPPSVPPAPPSAPAPPPTAPSAPPPTPRPARPAVVAASPPVVDRAPPAPIAQSAPPSSAPTGRTAPREGFDDEGRAARDGGGRKKMLVGLGVGAVVTVGVLGLVGVLLGDVESTTAVQTTLVEPAPAPAATDALTSGSVEAAEAAAPDVGDDPSAGEPLTFGDDAVLDALLEDCLSGELTTCDELYDQSAQGSDYQLVSSFCGGETDAEMTGGCVSPTGVALSGTVGAGEDKFFSAYLQVGTPLNLSVGNSTNVVADLVDPGGATVVSAQTSATFAVTEEGVHVVYLYSLDDEEFDYALELSTGS